MGLSLVSAQEGLPPHSVVIAALHVSLATGIVVFGKSYLSRYVGRISTLGSKQIAVQTFDSLGNPLVRSYRLGGVIPLGL